MRFFAPALVAIIAATAMPSLALANVSYTFKVPVTVTNLSNGATPEVECSVYNSQNGQGTQLATGQGTPALTLVNGSNSGTATVPVSSPSLPASYKCWLLVYSGSTIINIINGLPEEAQPGWTGKMLTSGNF